MRRGIRPLLVALIALAAADAVRADPTFDAEFAACRRLVKDEKWQSAQKAYADLFAKYKDDARIATQLPAIEDDLKQCQFRTGRQRPKGVELYGPEVTKFNIDSGDIELVFPSFRSGARVIGDADGKHKLLDLRFDRDMTIEAPADGYKKSNPPVTVSALLCWNPETRGGYFAAQGVTDRGDSVSHLEQLSCVIYDVAEGAKEPKLIAKNVSYPAEHGDDDYEVRFVRIARTSGAIRLDINKRLGVRADDSKRAGGYVALRASYANNAPISVRVKGKLDPVWNKQQIAAFEDKAFRAWAEKGYDRAAALPEWLRAGSAETSGAPEVPSDTPATVAPRLAALARKILRDDRAVATDDLVTASSLPEKTALYAAGLESLARGGAADAKTSFARLVEIEPLFTWGRVALARALLELRDFDGARAELAAARGFDAKLPAVYENLALVEFVKGDLAAARAALDEAATSGAVDASVERMTKIVSRAAEGPRWSKAYRYKSPHFDVRSDQSTQLCSDVAMKMELALKDYTQHFRPVEGAKGCARVDVFSSRDSYVAYAAEVGMDLSKTLGAYVPSLRELVVWCPDDRVEFQQTVRHEAFHQFVHNFAEDLPLWFNEGYAEYFGKGPLDAAPKTSGGDRSDIVAYLRQKRGSLTPLAKLLRASRSEFMAAADLHYPESWALISFLRSTKDPDLKPLLGSYFDALVAGASPDRAYEQVAAPRIEKLQSKFDAFLASVL
jgi:tetratricopeptide (TPR) repeat protein